MNILGLTVVITFFISFVNKGLTKAIDIEILDKYLIR